MGFSSGPHRARRRFIRSLTAPIVAAQISVCACDLAPKYEPPQYVLPANYQGSKPFKLAQPLDTMQRAPWWERFGDPLLNQLERQLTAENPDLAAFSEQYTQARDLAAEARSGLFPQLTASGLVSDNKESQHRLFHNPQSTFQTEEASNVIQETASWEPDFWSQIRNRTRAQKQLAQASAATLATARLSLQAELANDFIALRGLDGQAAIYRASIANYEKAIQTAFREVADGLAARGTYDEQIKALERFVKSQARGLELSDMRYRNGVDNYLSVLTAQTNLYTAQQLLITARLNRVTNLVDLYRELGGGWVEHAGDQPRPSDAMPNYRDIGTPTELTTRPSLFRELLDARQRLVSTTERTSGSGNVVKT